MVLPKDSIIVVAFVGIVVTSIALAGSCRDSIADLVIVVFAAFWSLAVAPAASSSCAGWRLNANAVFDEDPPTHGLTIPVEESASDQPSPGLRSIHSLAAKFCVGSCSGVLKDPVSGDTCIICIYAGVIRCACISILSIQPEKHVHICMTYIYIYN